MIDLPRSTYYYQPRPATAVLGDAELAHLIEDIHDVFPGYGYRRITLELRARGHVVNHKRVARIMREHEVYGIIGAGSSRRPALKPTSPSFLITIRTSFQRSQIVSGLPISPTSE